MATDIDVILEKIFNNPDSNEWNPSEVIASVNKVIDDVRKEMMDYLSNSEFNIKDLQEEGDLLLQECEELSEETTTSLNWIETETLDDIIKTIKSREIVESKLNTIQFSQNILFDVIHCGKMYKEFETSKRTQHLARAAELIVDVMTFINTPTDGFPELRIYEKFKNEATHSFNVFLQSLQVSWQKYFRCNTDVNEDFMTLYLHVYVDDSNAVNDLIHAMNTVKKLPDAMGNFARYLIDQVFIPIMRNQCTVSVINDEQIVVQIPCKNELKPHYDDTLTHLKKLFDFLSTKFNNIEVGKDCTLMTLMGQSISIPFKEALTTECLLETIPNNYEELQNYGVVLGKLEEFQDYLYEVQFMQKTTSITDFHKNIDVLFSNKCSQYYLNMAREIIFKDLSTMMLVETESVDDTPDTQVEEGTKGALDIFEEVFPRSLYLFPKCQISCSAQELVDLLVSMMDQAMMCAKIVAKRLYKTARLVVELYDAIVLYHHEKFLQNFPQYVALFHNNCMYLAHKLLILGEKWTNQMTIRSGSEPAYPVIFVDLVPRLRTLACDQMALMMQQQRNQILESIRNSDLSSIGAKDSLDANAEQAVKQCFRQLLRLRYLWVDVLPSNVYTKLMVTLTNMFMNELVHRVCSVEDISAETATQLSSMFDLVITKTPTCFLAPEDVASLESYPKLSELILVLRGTLKDIEARWDEGKGPLAAHFRPDEVKNLVRALFQNTQIRATLLSKIVERAD